MTQTEAFFERTFQFLGYRWFHAQAIAKRSPYVISIYGRLTNLTEPREHLPKTIAWGWDGLGVNIVEHGVGTIVTDQFNFDEAFGARSEKVSRELFIAEASPPGASPRWYGPVPSGEELEELIVKPILDYIALYT